MDGSRKDEGKVTFRTLLQFGLLVIVAPILLIIGMQHIGAGEGVRGISVLLGLWGAIIVGIER